MDAIYEECQKLTDEFYESLKQQYPHHREDGKIFISGLYVREAEKQRDAYYLKCLDERSYRVPLDPEKSSKKLKKDE